MQRTILFAFAGLALVGCVAEAPPPADGLTLTTRTPETLIGSYRQGALELRFESEATADHHLIALRTGDGSLLASVREDGGHVELSVPDGVGVANSESGGSRVDPNRHPELALLPWIAHDLGSRGVTARKYPSAASLQALGISFNALYKVDFSAQMSRAGDIGETTSALNEEGGGGCIEFICSSPNETFDPTVCDCVDISEREALRCSIPGNCPSSGSSCGSCGPIWWESAGCAFWAAIAVLTPGAFGLLSALQAGEWSAAATAAESVAGQTVLQELGAIPGVSSCVCVWTAAVEGCAKNLCSVVEYALGPNGNFCQ